jgi:hypothetical protein
VQKTWYSSMTCEKVRNTFGPCIALTQTLALFVKAQWRDKAVVLPAEVSRSRRASNSYTNQQRELHDRLGCKRETASRLWDEVQCERARRPAQ